MTQLARLCPQLARSLRSHAPPASPPGVPIAAAAVVITAALAGLTACGSTEPSAGQAAGSPRASTSPAASPTESSPASPAAGSRPAAALAECSVPALRVTLDGSAAGAAAGSSYVPLQFTNTSARSCTLPEYPAVAFASAAAGPPIGALATLAMGTPAKGARARTIVLARRAIAHAWLQIADTANYPAGSCQPVQAKGLLVSFAGTAPAAFLAHPFEACARTMRNSDVLAVFPVQAGRARRGTVP
jgi:hypothetical protein